MNLVLESLIRKKPYSAGIRHQVYLKKNLFVTTKLQKKLSNSILSNGGRNNSGSIAIRHRGGRLRRSMRLIDFSRELSHAVPCIVKTIEYDSFRSSFISMIYSLNGIYSYIICPLGISIGHQIYRYTNRPEYYLSGHISKLLYIPEGSVIHNIEKHPGFSGVFVRAAGTFSILLFKDFNSRQATIRMPSGNTYKISLFCSATLGRISNKLNMHLVVGKAGNSRLLGQRPSVRGVAMNPIDHPHGGGEGKKSKRVTPMSPWGKVCKFKKTRRVSYK